MQPPSSSSSTIPYTRHHFIRDVLELAKQRLLSRHASNVTATATSSSSYSVQGEMNANDNSNADLMDMIVGICYILVVLLFLVKILLKILGGFESHFMSSHDGAYNRFAFIANEDFEQETEEEEEEEEELESNDDTDIESLSSSSPISLRSTLSITTPVTHVPNIITPMNKINVVTPKTPSAPRRSLRLKIKSELNLTSMKKLNLNKTNVVTRSQTRESRGGRHFTNEKNSVSSDPPPSSLPTTSLFYRNQNKNFVVLTATPSSSHPENDEELAFIIQRCYERTMKKRSGFKSPLRVRRLVL